MKFNSGIFTAPVMLAGMLLMTSSHAASVSYYLNQSNVTGLPDGTNYLQVTLDDNTSGATDPLITFTVDVLTLSEGGVLEPTTNFGIQSFAFNLFGTASLQASDIIGLPVLWEVDTDTSGDIKPGSADGFGVHDVRITDTGRNRVDPLVFSIDVAGDSFSDYFDSSIAGGQGPSWFSAHVAGIRTDTYVETFIPTSGDPDPDSESPLCDPSNYSRDGYGCIELQSAWFGSQDGGGGPPAAIPVPAAVWLFGSGLLGLVGVARRRRA